MFPGQALQFASRTPFVAGYLVVAWGVFFALAVVDFDGRRELADPFGFPVPGSFEELPGSVSRLPVAPFVNAGVAQVLYVTGLLLIFGRRLELSAGSRTAALAFLGATYAGALVATITLNMDGLLPVGRLDPVWQEGWERHWNGGSAGCYGLVGVLAARSGRGPRIIAAVLLWEAALTFVHLRSFTPVFHLGALAGGYLIGVLPSRNAGVHVVAAAPGRRMPTSL